MKEKLGYYVKKQQDDVVRLFGLFDKLTAMRLGYFIRSVGDRDTLARKGNLYELVNNYEQYTRNEINYLKAYPEESRYNQVIVSRKHSIYDKSWNAFSCDSCDYLFTNDLTRYIRTKGGQGDE